MRDDARALCPDACGSQEGVDRWHDAKVAGDAATGAFIAGGVSVVAATLLWLTASPTATASGSEQARRGWPEHVEVRLLGPGRGGAEKASLAFGGQW